MKNTKNLTRIYLLLGLPVILAIALSLFTELQHESTDYTNQALVKKQSINWDDLKSLPIQKGGRIMPLDSFARVVLTQLSGKSTIKFEGKKLTAIEWLAKTVFENTTNDYPLFLIENPEVLDALRIKYTTDRDRYPYTIIREKVDLIHRYAGQAASVEQEKRSIFQNQIIHLSNNVFQYESLLNSLIFWQPMKGLSGADLFYGKIARKLNDVRVENPNMNRFYREAVQEIITFPYSKSRGVSIVQYMYHMYAASEVFRKYGKIDMRNEIVKVEKGLHEKEIRKFYNEIFSMIPSPEKELLQRVNDFDGEKDLPSEMEKNLSHYISHFVSDGLIMKIAPHRYKITEKGEKALTNIEKDWTAPWYIFYSRFEEKDLRKDSLIALNLIFMDLEKMKSQKSMTD